MDTSKLKPFDLEKALNGAGVLMLSADETEYYKTSQFHVFKNIRTEGENKDLVSFSYEKNGNNYLSVFSLEGKDVDGDQRLFMAPTKKEGWINIYKADNIAYSGIIAECKNCYRSEDEAKNNAIGVVNYIATIKIEWEE